MVALTLKAQQWRNLNHLSKCLCTQHPRLGASTPKLQRSRNLRHPTTRTWTLHPTSILNLPYLSNNYEVFDQMSDSESSDTSSIYSQALKIAQSQPFEQLPAYAASETGSVDSEASTIAEPEPSEHKDLDVRLPATDWSWAAYRIILAALFSGALLWYRPFLRGFPRPLHQQSLTTAQQQRNMDRHSCNRTCISWSAAYDLLQLDLCHPSPLLRLARIGNLFGRAVQQRLLQRCPSSCYHPRPYLRYRYHDHRCTHPSYCEQLVRQKARPRLRHPVRSSRCAGSSMGLRGYCAPQPIQRQEHLSYHDSYLRPSSLESLWHFYESDLPKPTPSPKNHHNVTISHQLWNQCQLLRPDVSTSTPLSTSYPLQTLSSHSHTTFPLCTFLPTPQSSQVPLPTAL